MALPEMTRVESSNVHSVGHDGTALYVRFRGAGGTPGALYRYATAAREHHDGMINADSPGQYFLNRVKHQHGGERVNE